LLAYAQELRSGIILDAKREIELDGWHVTYNETDLYTHERVIFRARLLADRPATADVAARAAFLRTHTVLILDEGALAAPLHRTGRWLKECYQAGRTPQVAVWAATQRPKEVSNLMFTEAWTIMVSLAPAPPELDRGKLSGLLPISFEAACKEKWPPYTWYAHIRGQEAVTFAAR
jgi:hypothetical protein